MVPVRRGYWGRKVGKPHTVPVKVTGKCGSVRVRLVPAPRGCGLVAAPVPKKLLNMAGVKDVYTSTTGNSRTLGNFVKAVFQALSKTYGYLTPDLWPTAVSGKAPYQEHTDFLQGTWWIHIERESFIWVDEVLMSSVSDGVIDDRLPRQGGVQPPV